MKTDGQRMFVLDGGASLRVLDVSGDRPRLVTTVELPSAWTSGMLLEGDRLLVLGSPATPVRGGQAAPDAPLNMPESGTQAILLDVSDLAAPRILERYVVSGWMLGARLTGTTVRLVTDDEPNLALRADALPARSTTSLRQVRTAWRKALRASTQTAWLPRMRHHRPHQTTLRGAAVGCGDVSRPSEYAGVGTVTVTTFDVEAGLTPVDTDSILATGGTIYASPTALYVATARQLDPSWYSSDAPPPPVDTVVHRFDTSSPTSTAYVGSGQVRGTVLNQFAMSELDGVLRVATTELPPWWTGDVPEQATSQSFVTTLQLRDGRLEQLGRVGGLGKGERIYATRFIGDRAYVVTFRQVDPLHVVDLVRPREPDAARRAPHRRLQRVPPPRRRPPAARHRPGRGRGRARQGHAGLAVRRLRPRRAAPPLAHCGCPAPGRTPSGITTPSSGGRPARSASCRCRRRPPRATATATASSARSR